MSTIKIPTRYLVGMLKDLGHTAGTEPLFPELCAVLLHTDRADVTIESHDNDEEPLIDVVPSDVLIGTSTDRSIIGQAHCPCEGSLHRPVLVSAVDAKAIVSVFTPLMKSLPKTETHETELELRGQTLTVAESDTQVPGGTEMSVSVLDCITEFPWKVAEALTPDPDAEVRDDNQRVVGPTYGTGVAGDHLAALGAVAKRRRMQPVWYGSHQQHVVVVTIGDWYRAALVPRSAAVEDALAEPLVPVFQPEFPTKVGSVTEPMAV